MSVMSLVIKYQLPIWNVLISQNLSVSFCSSRTIQDQTNFFSKQKKKIKKKIKMNGFVSCLFWEKRNLTSDNNVEEGSIYLYNNIRLAWIKGVNTWIHEYKNTLRYDMLLTDWYSEKLAPHPGAPVFIGSLPTSCMPLNSFLWRHHLSTSLAHWLVIVIGLGRCSPFPRTLPTTFLSG